MAKATLLPLTLALLVAGAAFLTAQPSSSVTGGTLLPRTSTGKAIEDASLSPLSQKCASGADSNLTVCSFDYAQASGADLPAKEHGEAQSSSSDSDQVSDDSETMADKWSNFLVDMEQYSDEVRTFLMDLANHASSWSDLAKEWRYFTVELPPYNAPLPTSAQTVDKYTDDVSAYSAALSSFASGFSVTAEESAAEAAEFTKLASELQARPSGWDSARDLLTQANAVSSSVSYLSTYAKDLATYTGVWFDNVDFLAKKSNSTVSAYDSVYDILDNANYLKIYADDVAAFSADWGRHSEEMNKWTADWTQYGEAYGVEQAQQ